MKGLSCLCSIMILMGMESCKPGVPARYIQPDDMEDILCDFHIAQGMGQNLSNSENERNYQIQLYEDAVLKKYGVTKAEFDSSLLFYYKRADWFREMYEHISDRLNKQALSYGASQGELSLMTLSNSGDTADIWTERKAMLLTPVAPYNSYQFSIKADTSFYRRDHFMLTFNSTYICQDGQREGIAYLAIVYQNDSVATQMHRINSSGFVQMRMSNKSEQPVKMLKGFFYLGRGVKDSKSTLKLMFLNNIHLIRFHQRNEDQQNIPSSSGERIGDGGREKIDSVRRGAKLRMGDSLLPPNPRIASDRMVGGDDLPEKGGLRKPAKSLPQRVPINLKK